MPSLISSLATIIASAFATSAVASSIVYGVVYGALSIGLALGIGALASSLIPKPKPPAPEDVQQSTRQPIQPRFRHYGRVKTSGPWVFAESLNGHFHKVLALGEGELDAIEEYWVDDVQVQLNDHCHAYGGKFGATAGAATGPRIETKLGTDTQTAFSDLTAFFSDWTSDHTAKGVALLYTTQFAVSSKIYLSTYPNGIQTSYRCVVRGAKIENPLTGDIEWSDNPIAIIRDYMTSPEGMRLPEAIFKTPEAIAGILNSYLVCDEPIPLKEEGGTEKRYRAWGTYRYDERPGDVLFRMLRACDGQLAITSDGGLTIRAGKWSTPTVTLDENSIVAFSGVGRGRDVLTTANTIRASFLDQTHDFQTGDADPWVDENDVSERGEISAEVSFIMAPSHSQCRRLMKLEAYRVNPNFVGTFICNLKGLAAFNERFININYPPLGINETFEILDFKFNFGRDNILESVTIQVASFPQEAYNWNAALEEGTAPISEGTSVDSAIPVPENLCVAIGQKSSSGTSFVYAAVSANLPPTVVLLLEIQYRESTPSALWNRIDLVDFDNYGETAALSSGVDYEFRARFITESGRPGDWSATVTKTATADLTAPDPVIRNGLAHIGVRYGDEVFLKWRSPDSENFAKTFIYRNTVDDEESASLVSPPEYGAPNSEFERIDRDVVVGRRYHYWLTAVNASNIESESVYFGSVRVAPFPHIKD